VVLAAELVPAVGDPVRPRDQQLPPPAAAHLVLGIAVEDVGAAELVTAQAAADLDDGGPLVAVPKLDLLPGGWLGRSHGTSLLIPSHLAQRGS
jgi:hypothetical protein